MQSLQVNSEKKEGVEGGRTCQTHQWVTVEK